MKKTNYITILATLLIITNSAAAGVITGSVVSSEPNIKDERYTVNVQECKDYATFPKEDNNGLLGGTKAALGGSLPELFGGVAGALLGNGLVSSKRIPAVRPLAALGGGFLGANVARQLTKSKGKSEIVTHCENIPTTKVRQVIAGYTTVVDIATGTQTFTTPNRYNVGEFITLQQTLTLN